MNAEILSATPLSGDYPETRFDASGNCTWVKFTDSEHSDWCGIFGAGSYGLTVALFMPDKPEAFVVSSGQGYWVNIETQQLLHKTEIDYFQAAFWPVDRDFVIAATWTNIFFISPTGEIWDSERISWDGIRFGAYTDGVLSCEVDDLSPDACKVTLNVTERRVYGAPKFSTGAA